MISVLLLGRLVLCGVFLAAGLSKLRDLAGSRQSLIDFGLTLALAKPFSILLPMCELIVAIGMLLASFAWISAVGALVLLVLLILAIVVTLARGRKPDCHCFGQLHSKPIGWDLVGRNAALTIVAALVIRGGPRQPSFGGGIHASTPVLTALLLAVVALLIFQTWLIFQLIQQGGRVLLRLDALEKQAGGSVAEQPVAPPGLPVGETAPEFELEDVEGHSVSLKQLSERRTRIAAVHTSGLWPLLGIVAGSCWVAAGCGRSVSPGSGLARDQGRESRQNKRACH